MPSTRLGLPRTCAYSVWAASPQSECLVEIPMLFRQGFNWLFTLSIILVPFLHKRRYHSSQYERLLIVPRVHVPLGNTIFLRNTENYSSPKAVSLVRHLPSSGCFSSGSRNGSMTMIGTGGWPQDGILSPNGGNAGQSGECCCWCCCCWVCLWFAPSNWCSGSLGCVEL